MGGCHGCELMKGMSNHVQDVLQKCNHLQAAVLHQYVLFNLIEVRGVIRRVDRDYPL